MANVPAAHGIEIRRRVPEVHVLDNEPAMLALASRRAKEAHCPVHFHLADMGKFTLASPVNLAFCMLDSLSHLHTQEAMNRHLDAVARATAPNAIYIIELGLPRSAGKPAMLEHWRIVDDEHELAIRWGDEHEAVNSETGVVRSRVEIKIDGPDTKEVVRDTLMFRRWTLEDMQHCLEEVPEWDLREVFGGFVKFDLLHEEAWRMILVLAKQN